MDKIKIVIAEDHAMVSGALTALLNMEPDLQVVGCAVDGEAALRLITQVDPDVVLTDIEMPRMGGLELARAIQEQGLACRVIVLTTFARGGYLRRALDAGVAGYLLKAAPAESLAQAIRAVKRGGRAIDPELAVASWGEADPLSERERQTLRQAEEGLTAGEIATRMCLSEGTVRNYLSEAIGKLNAANRIEAARIARDKGWL